MLVLAHAWSAPAKPLFNGGTVEVLVASELAPTEKWRKAVCADLTAHLNSLPTHKFEVRCTLKTADEIYDIVHEKFWVARDPRFAFMLTLLEDFTGDLRLGYVQSVVDSSPPALEWKTSMQNPKAGRTGLRKLVQNVAAFRVERDAIARHFVQAAAKYSEKITFTKSQDEFVDKSTGKKINWRCAVALFSNENQYQKQYLRTALELAAFLGGGTVWYYSHHEVNAPDQQYSTADLDRRFTSFHVIRYDDNSPGINRKHVYDSGDLLGYSVTWGPVSSMTIENETNLDGTAREMEATVGLLGNAISLNGFFKEYRVNMQFDVQRVGYSYGFGMTVRTKVSLNYGKIETGVAVTQTQIDATNARSRYFETVTQPLAVTEKKSAGEIFAAVNLNEMWRMQCGLQRRQRSGTIEEYAPAGRIESRRYCLISTDLK